MPLQREKPKPLGRDLQEKRSFLRLSQDDMVELFAKAGKKIDKSAISRIENGKATMPEGFHAEYMAILQKIATEDAEAVGLKIQASEVKMSQDQDKDTPSE